MTKSHKALVIRYTSPRVAIASVRAKQLAFWDIHTQRDLGENWPLFVIPLVKQLIPIILMTVFFLASMVRVPQVAQDAENRIRKRTPSPQNPLPWSMVNCAQVVANALPNGCQLSASFLTPGNQTHASKLNDNGLERSRGTKGVQRNRASSDSVLSALQGSLCP